MSDEKKNVAVPESEDKIEEINIEETDVVSGGGIGDVVYKERETISTDTIEKF